MVLVFGKDKEVNESKLLDYEQSSKGTSQSLEKKKKVMRQKDNCTIGKHQQKDKNKPLTYIWNNKNN